MQGFLTFRQSFFISITCKSVQPPRHRKGSLPETAGLRAAGVFFSVGDPARFPVKCGLPHSTFHCVFRGGALPPGATQNTPHQNICCPPFVPQSFVFARPLSRRHPPISLFWRVFAKLCSKKPQSAQKTGKKDAKQHHRKGAWKCPTRVPNAHR